jgi:hypothetical protein
MHGLKLSSLEVCAVAIVECVPGSLSEARWLLFRRRLITSRSYVFYHLPRGTTRDLY